MPAPMPTIDVATGRITYGYNGGQELQQGQQFAWVTTSSGSVWVHPQGGPNNAPWFTPHNGSGNVSFMGPASGPLADNSNVATIASSVQGEPPAGWQYGSNLLSNFGHVKIIAAAPARIAS